MTSKFKFDVTGHRAGHHFGAWAVAAVLAATALAGCSYYNTASQQITKHITPYQITVVQGNFVSSEAAAKLHVGMTREEVRSVLGTPLLTDMFHNDRWDYLFYFQRGTTQVVQRRELTVFFEQDKLARWTGAENLPSEQELLADIDGDRKAAASLASERRAREAAAASAASAAPAATAAPASAPADGSQTNTGSFGLRSPGAPIGASAAGDHAQFSLPTQAPASAASTGAVN
jgi:outer membrane protein assembly factor BamE